MIEYSKNSQKDKIIILFDFDGTISTLRFGWEQVMYQMMIDLIGSIAEPNEEIKKMIEEYIDSSAGIQTIFQMKWFVETLIGLANGENINTDPWWYKKEYNSRLMKIVDIRKNDILINKRTEGDYMIKGSKEFIEELKGLECELYVASGTDHDDVTKEVGILGLTKYFNRIIGAPPGIEKCSKEGLIRDFIEKDHFKGKRFFIIGDGKVEISLGKAMGARTIGVASNEVTGQGINRVKVKRLKKAGADLIIGDFSDKQVLINWIIKN